MATRGCGVRVGVVAAALLGLAAACGVAAWSERTWADEASGDQAPAGEGEHPPAEFAGHDAHWWVGQLKEERTYRVALEALRLIGRPGFPALERALASEDARVRRGAAEVLRGFRGPMLEVAAGIASALARPLGDEEADRLLDLAKRAGDSPAVVEAVARLVSSPDPGVRTRALETLGDFPVPAKELLPLLRRLLAEPDTATVAATLSSLDRMGTAGREATPEVLGILAAADTRPASVVRAAIQVLPRIGAAGPEVVAALRAVAVDPDAEGGLAAVKALAGLSRDEPGVEAALLDVASEGPTERRRSALQALGERDRPLDATTGRVVELLRSPDPEVASGIAGVLHRVGARGRGLLPALADRLAAAPNEASLRGAFARIAASAPEALPEVLPKIPVGLRAFVLGALSGGSGALPADPVASALVVALGAWTSESPEVTDPVVLARLLQRMLSAPSRPDALDVLSRWLLHPSSELATASAVLLDRTSEGRRARIRMLVSEDVLERRGALKHFAAGRASPLSEEDRSTIEAALDDPDEEVRRATAYFLGTTGRRPSFNFPSEEWPASRRPALARAALDLMRQPDAASQGVGLGLYVEAKVPLPEALPLLRGMSVEAGGNSRPHLLAEAYALTSEHADAKVRDALLEDLDSPDAMRRADAALVLVALGAGGPEVLAALPPLLRHLSPRVAGRALDAAHRLGPAASALEDDLVDLALRREPPALAIAAVGALAAVAPASPRTLETLRTLLLDASRPWRVGTVPGAIAALGPAGAPLLVEGLGDPALQPACLNALRGMGASAASALPDLEALLARRPEDATLRALVEGLRRR